MMSSGNVLAQLVAINFTHGRACMLNPQTQYHEKAEQLEYPSVLTTYGPILDLINPVSGAINNNPAPPHPCRWNINTQKVIWAAPHCTRLNAQH